MMKSKDFDACKQEQDKRDLRKAMGLDEDSEPEEENGGMIFSFLTHIFASKDIETSPDDKKPESGPRKKLQLDPSVRIESQDQPAELFKDVINIEQQLSSSARPAYPKIGTCAKFFDKLLEKKQGAVVKTEANGESTDGDKPKSNGGTPSSSNNRLLYPEAPSFNILSDKKSILVLAKHDAKRLARKAGMAQCEGFNYNSKPNPQVMLFLWVKINQNKKSTMQNILELFLLEIEKLFFYRHGHTPVLGQLLELHGFIDWHLQILYKVWPCTLEFCGRV